MEQLFGPVTPGLIIVVIAGLVEISKKVKNREPVAWELVLSAVLGVLFGGGWYVAQQAEAGPLSLLIWIGGVVYGLLVGLSVSGLYDIVRKQMGKLTDVLKQV